MKKIIVVSIVALISLGFTLKSDSNQKYETDCPYLNKIHSSSEMNKSDCPYLEGRISQKSERQNSKECPYKNESKMNSSECPFLNKGEKLETLDEIPKTKIKLKAS